MLNPADITRTAFEEKYEIYPRTAFMLHTHWTSKCFEWIKVMGLDCSPFSYIKVAPTDVETQVLEAAWAGNLLLNAKL
jgi:hypothetical protein